MPDREVCGGRDHIPCMRRLLANAAEAMRTAAMIRNVHLQKCVERIHLLSGSAGKNECMSVLDGSELDAEALHAGKLDIVVRRV